MPWEPRPQSSNPFAWARVLGSYGMTEAEIAQRLRQTYNTPGAPRAAIREQEVLRAALLGHRWGNRVNTLRDTAGDTARPLRSWSFVNPNIPEAYRYHVIFHLAPDAEGNETHRTIIVNSARRLSFEEIGELAVNTFQQIHMTSDLLRNVYIDGATPWDLAHMERRSN